MTLIELLASEFVNARCSRTRCRRSAAWLAALTAMVAPLGVAHAAPNAPSNVGVLPPPPPAPADTASSPPAPARTPAPAPAPARTPAPAPARAPAPAFAPAPALAPAPAYRPEAFHFFARGTVGFGPVIPSAQEDLIEKEGYGGGRWFFLGDGVGMLSRHFGVGGFLGGSYRTSQPMNNAPTLTDSAWFVGPEGAAWVGGDDCGLLLELQLGFMRGTEQFHGGGAAKDAFAYGGEAGLMCLKFPITVSAGALSAPTSPPGQAGRSWNMGTIHLSVGFALHD